MKLSHYSGYHPYCPCLFVLGDPSTLKDKIPWMLPEWMRMAISMCLARVWYHWSLEKPIHSSGALLSQLEGQAWDHPC